MNSAREPFLNCHTSREFSSTANIGKKTPLYFLSAAEYIFFYVLISNNSLNLSCESQAMQPSSCATSNTFSENRIDLVKYVF